MITLEMQISIMSSVNIKCQVPTPKHIVIEMLDEIGYMHNLYGKKLLENSCGSGAFLLEVVARYILDCKKNGLSNNSIRFGLEQDIHGFEKDERLYNKCIDSLNALVAEFGISDVNWSIRIADALAEETDAQYHYVVGNPPYLAYPDQDSITRKYLRSHFQNCQKGKPDYYYAFVEKALASLHPEGKLVYLVPGNFMKNYFSEDLRQMLKHSIDKIIDYSHTSLFSGYLTSSVILVCDLKKQSNVLWYVNKHYNYQVRTTKEALKGKWVFEKKSKQDDLTSFSSYFHASAPVATQLNSAFVLSNYIKEGQYLCHTDGIVEIDATRKAASPRSYRLDRDERIIFPYNYHQGTLIHISEDKLLKEYPHAYEYLKKHKEDLLKRKSDDGAKWYEYGRSQLLSHLQQEKLLTSTFVTKIPSLYKLDQDTVPYAGICIISKSNRSIDQAYRILSSDHFLEYVKRIGVCTNSGSYRISPRDINRYCFPTGLLEDE